MAWAGGAGACGDGAGPLRRLDPARRPAPRRAGGPPGVRRRPFRGLSASLGLAGPIAADLSWRAAAGRTFRAPGLAELHLRAGPGGPQRRPPPGDQPGRRRRAGGRRAARPGLAWAATSPATATSSSTSRATRWGGSSPFNSGQALAAGLEAEAATAPVAGPLRATAAASYTLPPHQAPARRAGRGRPLAPLPARATGSTPGPRRAGALRRSTSRPSYVGRRFEDLRNVEPHPRHAGLERRRLGGHLAGPRPPPPRRGAEPDRRPDAQRRLRRTPSRRGW